MTVTPDITPDDLVFELRRAVAELVHTSLARVALSWAGRVVTLGVDVGSDMTAARLQGLCAAGQVVVQIAEGEGSRLSDAQIDSMVEKWQRGRVAGAGVGAGLGPGVSDSPGRALPRGLVSDGDDDDGGASWLARERGSLEGMWCSLEGEGLSDDELAVKVSWRRSLGALCCCCCWLWGLWGLWGWDWVCC